MIYNSCICPNIHNESSRVDVSAQILIDMHLLIMWIDLRQKALSHHLWKAQEEIFSCYLKLISRAMKCHKKIAQDFLCCTYANIHSLSFLPLPDIYFVHSPSFPVGEGEHEPKQGNTLSSGSVFLVDVSLHFPPVFVFTGEGNGLVTATEYQPP